MSPLPPATVGIQLSGEDNQCRGATEVEDCTRIYSLVGSPTEDDNLKHIYVLISCSVCGLVTSVVVSLVMWGIISALRKASDVMELLPKRLLEEEDGEIGREGEGEGGGGQVEGEGGGGQGEGEGGGGQGEGEGDGAGEGEEESSHRKAAGMLGPVSDLNNCTTGTIQEEDNIKVSRKTVT